MIWIPADRSATASGCTFQPLSTSTISFALATGVIAGIFSGAATSVLRRYEAALNGADVDAIVSLYTPDAVFMAQHRNPAVGRAEIETAYREIFGMIRLDITFEIDEVVVVSSTVAYARTRSAGTTTILANDAQVTEANQELFVLVRDDQSSDWRIGRYIFSTTQPPRN